MSRRCDDWKNDVHDASDALLVLRAFAMSEDNNPDLDLGNGYGCFDARSLDFSP